MYSIQLSFIITLRTYPVNLSFGEYLGRAYVFLSTIIIRNYAAQKVSCTVLIYTTAHMKQIRSSNIYFDANKIFKKAYVWTKFKSPHRTYQRIWASSLALYKQQTLSGLTERMLKKWKKLIVHFLAICIDWRYNKKNKYRILNFTDHGSCWEYSTAPLLW